jgi:hypothetical protein
VKRNIAWIIGLCAIALGMRLALLVALGGLDEQIHDSMHDQYTYLDLARHLAAGKGFEVSTNIWVADAETQTSLFPPLYPLFLASCLRLFGERLLAIRIVQILLSLIIVVSVYLIGMYMFDRRTAALAGLATALYPALALYVRPIMSEAVFFPLVALLVLISCRIDHHPRAHWSYLAWGVVAGLSILTRTEVALLIAMLLPFFAYRQWRAVRRIYLPGFAALVLAAVLVVLPYAFYNYSAHGSFTPFPNARWKLWDHTWLAAMREQPDWSNRMLPEREVVPDWSHKTERERDAYLWNMALQFIAEHPTQYLSQRAKQLLRAYPIVPLEEIPVPLGRKGIEQKPDGYDYGPSSLDDVVRYVTPLEKVRVWLFRSALLLAIGGLALIFYYRKRQAYILALVLVWNAVHSAALVGSERLRLQIDPYLLLIGMLFVSYAWAQLERWMFHRARTTIAASMPAAINSSKE